MNPRNVVLTTLFVAVFSSACTTFSQDGGTGDTSLLIEQRLGKRPVFIKSEQTREAMQDVIASIIAHPLSADDAVQIALLNNPDLQTTYGELGIAEADLVQAGKLQNPGLSFKHTQGGGQTFIERSLTFNLINLIIAPLASKLESRRFEMVKLQVATAALKLAAETRIAYFEAVATGQTNIYMKQVSLAAQASADLARRMAANGNWSALDQAKQQVFSAEAANDVARAANTAIRAREKLNRLMGLEAGNLSYQLPDVLPELPLQPQETTTLYSAMIDARLDIQAAKRETEWLADDLKFSRTNGFMQVLNLGPVLNTGEEVPRAHGYEIDLSLPLFDWGEAKNHKAEALYLQSVNRLRATKLNAASEIRESIALYQSNYALAKRYRDEIIPLRKKISDETLLRYNGMLVSVFELLSDAREQVIDTTRAIDALKDYWIADSILQTATGTTIPENK